MIPTLPYPVALAAVVLAGVAVHEASHYAVATWAGADPSFAYRWDGLLPTPAVDPGPGLPFTPATWAATTLAPAVVCAPSLVAVAVLGPTGPALGLWAMWLFTTIPSPPDWIDAYHADAIAVERAVAAGPHPDHQTAEGIAPDAF